MSKEPLRILELRTVRGTGGGPEKTILLGTARTDPARYAITVCYVRDERDAVFHIDRRAQDLPLDYVEVRERNSFDPHIWSQLTALIATRRIEIVHSHDYKTDLLAWLISKRKGTIAMATAHGWTGHSARERWVYYPADRWLLGRVSHVIAVSSQIRNALIQSGAQPDNVTVILNGIDPTAVRRERGRETEARASLAVSPQDVVVGAVGRLEAQKDFAGLIAAFSTVAGQVPRARLLIAGDGSLRANLQAQIDSLGLADRCRLLGQVDEVARLHHAFDVFVQSSLYEGTPNAILEAMAFESPIVATAAGGTTELVRDGVEALIVPCGDRAALTGALLTTLSDLPEARCRAAAGRRRVETELSFDARLRRVERIYDDLAVRFLRRRRRYTDPYSRCATS